MEDSEEKGITSLGMKRSDLREFLLTEDGFKKNGIIIR